MAVPCCVGYRSATVLGLILFVFVLLHCLLPLRTAIKIGADENDAGGNRRGQDTNRDGNSAVKAYASRLRSPLNRRFKPQWKSPASGKYLS